MNSVDALIDVVRKIVIYKSEVLEFLGVSAENLANAYCIAGCDDIEVALKGVGIKKALSFI